MELELAELTSRMKAGEESAFRQFYSSYADRLWRYVLVAARGDEQQAQEVLQEMMYRVVRHIRRFDSEEVFWSWLTTLARSAAVDLARKRSRYRDLLSRFFQLISIAPSEPEDPAAPMIEVLCDSLCSLAPDERELVDRKYLKGETVEQMAAELFTTQKAIESRLVRARRRLKTIVLERLKNEK